MKKQDKLPYSDDLADAIIAEHGLNPSVKKVWKTRGHIPGDYLDENRDSSAKIGDRDPEYQRFREILERPEIAASKFRTLGQKGADVQRGKDRMTEAERVGFKTEITELRNKLRIAKDTRTNSAIKTALKDVRFHPTKIIHYTLYDKVMRDGFLQEHEKTDIQFRFLALYNHLKF